MPYNNEQHEPIRSTTEVYCAGGCGASVVLIVQLDTDIDAELVGRGWSIIEGQRYCPECGAKA